MASRLATLPALFLAVAASAAEFPKDLQTYLERINSFPTISGRSPAGAAMSPDGKHIVFGWNTTGERRLDAWIMDLPGGKKSRIVEADKIARLPDQDKIQTEEEKKDEKEYDGGIGHFEWSPDGKEILFAYHGRTWLMDPDGKNLRPLIDTKEQVSSPQFSPDGKYISFTRSGNVYRLTRANGFVKQLTFVSAPQTFIAQSHWSPDSKNLAVYWENSSKTGHATMMDYSKDHATPVTISRDWNGEESYAYKLGFVSAEGGLIKYVDKLPTYCWIRGADWTPDSKRYAIAWTNDVGNEGTISLVNLATVKKIDIYHQTAPKNYVSHYQPVRFSRDGKRLYFVTDIWQGKFTKRGVISMDPFGNDVKQVVPGLEVAAMFRPEKSDRLFLVTQQASPLATEITVLEPNGKQTHLDPFPDGTGFATAKEFDNAGNPLVSEDGKVVATEAGHFGLNPELYLLQPTAQRLTESQTPDFKNFNWPDMKEVTFPAPDGATIHAMLLTPKDMKPGEKLPAVVSGIYANSGKMAWNGFTDAFLASYCRFAVLVVDFRASYGYGGEFMTGYYKSLGVVDADEAVAAKNYLASLPYVRGDRVGIWGWSYGGFLTCMVMTTKPGVFHTGVAVASVTNWHNYNEGYTRPRMGLPKDKGGEDIYKKCSPLYHAAGLEGNLLMVHGILDDNVLAQDTIQMLQKMIEAGKHPDIALYPRDDHGIGKVESRKHVFVTIVKYLYEKLTS